MTRLRTAVPGTVRSLKVIRGGGGARSGLCLVSAPVQIIGLIFHF